MEKDIGGESSRVYRKNLALEGTEKLQKTQEVLGRNVEEGLKLLEENM